MFSDWEEVVPGNVFRICAFLGATDVVCSLINISMSGEVKSLTIGVIYEGHIDCVAGLVNDSRRGIFVVEAMFIHMGGMWPKTPLVHAGLQYM